jgi:small subunit ribosomal protein S15
VAEDGTMPLEKQHQADVIQKNRRHEADSGSPEVQIAILTERIRHLTQHLKTASKDFSTRRGLLKLVGKRSRLLRYLARTQPDTYQGLIARLGIRR